MPSESNQYIEPHMDVALEGHVLTELTSSGSPVRVFRLHPPSSTDRMATLLTFTPEGIVIQGDLRPGENGVLSGKSYNLDWFCDVLDQGDLCAAFLQKSWQPLAAARDVLALPHTERTEQYLKMASAKVMGGHVSEKELRSFLISYGFSPAEVDTVGYDYPLGDAGWLCAIQRRFAALRRQIN